MRVTGTAPAILFRSGDTLVTDLGSAIRFAQRGLTEAGFGAGALLAGLFFWVESRGWPPFTTLAPRTFGEWTAWVLWPIGALLLFLALVRRMTPPWELSSELRCLKRGSRRVPFDDIRGVNMTEIRMGRTTAVALRLDSTRGAIWLVRGQPERRRDQLQRVTERVQAQLGAVATAGRATPGEIRVVSSRRFFAAFALVLGAIWTSMVWVVPDLVVTSPWSSSGLRFWPLGLWIAALGVGELAGLKPFEILLGPRNGRRAIFGILWFGSYCAAAYVHL